MSSTEVMAASSGKRPLSESAIALVTALLLILQTILLVFVARRVLNLERILNGVQAPPAAPIVLDHIPDSGGHSLGPEDAPIVVVEFSDFQCPFCASAAGPIKELLSENSGAIRFVYRHYPLTAIHADAFGAAEAAECAGEQGKFWEMHDALFAHQEALEPEALTGYARELGLDPNRFDSCMAEGRMRPRVEKDLEDARGYGLSGTPTFFVNNEMASGITDVGLQVRQLLATP